MEGYKIEDVARECGLTKRTIRYYEEIGLLFPPERSTGGFRLYSDKHIERLRQIIIARDVLGISLHEIQEFVSVSEELSNLREGIRHSEGDELNKVQKISEIEVNLQRQLQMINQKLEKLTSFRNEISELYSRVLEVKKNLSSKKE